MTNVLVYVLIVLLIAYVITYCINAFVPVDPALKKIVVVIIWALAILASLMQFLPLLKI
jgi:predicted membrane channel-forming protein YqfA (hemolysin III family)